MLISILIVFLLFTKCLELELRINFMSEVEWRRNKIHKPLKLKILMKIFFLKQCFFLNSKPDAINLAIKPFDYCYWFEECENLWQKWFVEHYVFWLPRSAHLLFLKSFKITYFNPWVSYMSMLEKCHSCNSAWSQKMLQYFSIAFFWS